MKKVLVFLMMAIVACGLLLTGCGGDAKQAAETKILRAGTEPAFAPFEFPKEDSKELTGFDVELIQALGKQLGYTKVEIVSMGFDALIPALNGGTIDCAIAGMTITEERQKAISFSDPYYTSGLIIMVPKTSSVQSIDDLKGKTIATQIGTTGEMKARTVEGATVRTFNTQDEAALEVKNGGADAVIGDAPVVEYYLAQAGKDFAKTVGEKMEAEDYGIAVKKDNKLAADLSKALGELKKNGEYDKLYKKWFGAAK